MKFSSYMLMLGLYFLSLHCSTHKNIDLGSQKITLVNRSLDSSPDESTVKLNAQKGSGYGVLENVSFTTGAIELDLLGHNTPGKSFVGVAFNIQNDSTYEAIYFRPFNFQSKEKTRREHSIQYIHHPEYPWRKLRKEHNGVYESAFMNPPLPDEWFKVSITITADKLTVTDPRNGMILLSVDRLSETKSDKIGFWVGHNSKGGFKNLKLVRK